MPPLCHPRSSSASPPTWSRALPFSRPSLHDFGRAYQRGSECTVRAFGDRIQGSGWGLALLLLFFFSLLSRLGYQMSQQRSRDPPPPLLLEASSLKLTVLARAAGGTTQRLHYACARPMYACSQPRRESQMEYITASNSTVASASR